MASKSMKLLSIIFVSVLMLSACHTPPPPQSHTSDVWQVAWSPDGHTIATGSWDHTVNLWNAKSGQLIHTLRGYSDVIVGLAWSPDSTFIAAGDKAGKLIVWDAQTGKSQRTLEGEMAAWSPDGKTLATWFYYSAGKARSLWNWQTGGLLCAMELGPDSRISSAAWSLDGTKLAFVWGGAAIGRLDAKSCNDIWPEPPPGPMTSRESSIIVIAWSPNGKMVAGGSYDGPVFIWDVQKAGEPTTTFWKHIKRTGSVAWSPDSRLLASGASDGTIIIWDVKAEQPLLTLLGCPQPKGDPPPPQPPCEPKNSSEVLSGYIDGATSVAWSPDGKTLATAGFGFHSAEGPVEAVRLWDIATAKLVATFK